MKNTDFMQNWIAAIIGWWCLAFLGLATGAGSLGLYFAIVITIIIILWHFLITANVSKNANRAKAIGQYLRETYYTNRKNSEGYFLFEEYIYGDNTSVITKKSTTLNMIHASFPSKKRRTFAPNHTFVMDSAVEVHAYGKHIKRTIGDDSLKVYVYYGGYTGGNGETIKTNHYHISNSLNRTEDIYVDVTSNLGGASGGWYVVIGTEEAIQDYFSRPKYHYGKIYPKYRV